MTGAGHSGLLTTIPNRPPSAHMTTTPAPHSDIFTARFETGDLAKSADVTGAALQTWFRRGIILGAGEGVEMPGRAGVRRGFSFRNVIEVAMGAALIRNGLPPAAAFKAAAKFAHSGTDGRRIALPFPDAPTLLCAQGDRSAVVRQGPETDLQSVFGSPSKAGEGLVVVFAAEVFDRAVSALGWHPEAVLEAGYAEALQ